MTDIISITPYINNGLSIGDIVEMGDGAQTTYNAIYHHNGKRFSNYFESVEKAKRYLEEKYIACLRPFSDELIIAIKMSGVSVAEMAEDIGCSRAVIHKWMAGNSYPAVHHLWRLCMCLGIEERLGELVRLIESER